MSQQPPELVGTPCIGVCSTVFGDHVCRGCKRFAHEIIDWNGYDQPKKALVESRLGTLLAQVLDDKIRVINGPLLADRLAARGIRFSRHRPAACWVLDLLRATTDDIGDTREWGFEVLHPWQQNNLEVLKQIIDEQFFRLSEAHYRRYILPDSAPPATRP